MKKIYLKPALEVVDVKMQQPLMAGSEIDIYDDEEVKDPIDLLAPDLGLPSLPGANLPGFPF